MTGSAADLETDGVRSFGLPDRRPSTETGRDAHSDTGRSTQRVEDSQNQRFSQKHSILWELGSTSGGLLGVSRWLTRTVRFAEAGATRAQIVPVIQLGSAAG